MAATWDNPLLTTWDMQPLLQWDSPESEFAYSDWTHEDAVGFPGDSAPTTYELYVKAIKNINQRAGHRSDESDAIEALSESIDDFERSAFLPWFLLSESAQYVTLIGESRIPVPKRFLREYEEGALYIHDAQGNLKELEKKTYEQLTGAEVLSGEPEFYSLDGGYFNLRPIPDDNYYLQLKYYRASDKVWEAQTNYNAWLEEAYGLVVAEAAVLIMESTRDYKGLEVQEKKRDRARKEMLVRHTDRMETNLGRNKNEISCS